MVEMLDSDPILVLIGFVLLMAGGEGIVQGAVQIAYRLRVPPLLVGFTIVAIGTSLPELAVAIEAIAQNEPDIAVGGVLGSNVANVMLVLGTACMLGSGDEAGAGIRRDSVAVILATILLTAFVYYGSIPVEGGAFMLILLVSYYAYAYRSSKGKADAEEPEETSASENILLAVFATIAGGVMIWQGPIFLLDGGYWSSGYIRHTYCDCWTFLSSLRDFFTRVSSHSNCGYEKSRWRRCRQCIGLQCNEYPWNPRHSFCNRRRYRNRLEI